MGQVDEVNSAAHDDDYADGSKALESAEKNRNAAGKLCQAYQIADDRRLMQERRKVLRAGTAEGSDKIVLPW